MNAPMSMREWQALSRDEKRAAWQRWSNDERSAMFGLFAATTPTWALPYPEDYNDPADSPTAFRELALATDAALALMIQDSTAESRYVKGPVAIQINDWNSAINSGFYKSWPGSANVPSVALADVPWVGFSVQFDGNWIVQTVWPFQPYPRAMRFSRVCLNAGVWQPWRRETSYAYSYGTLSNLRFLNHGEPEVTRFSDGFKKDETSFSGTDLDEWRVQCYDLSGNFTWSAIKIPENGVVSMPRAFAAGVEALDSGRALDPEQVVTVGLVAKIIRAALDDPDSLARLTREADDGDR